MTSSVVGRIVGMLVCWHWWPIPLAHKYWKVHSHGFIRDWSTWSVTHKVPTKIKVPQIVTKCITGQFQTSNSISWKGLRQADSDQLHTTFHSTDLLCIVQKMKGNCYFALGILVANIVALRASKTSFKAKAHGAQRFNRTQIVTPGIKSLVHWAMQCMPSPKLAQPMLPLAPDCQSPL